MSGWTIAALAIAAVAWLLRGSTTCLVLGARRARELLAATGGAQALLRRIDGSLVATPGWRALHRGAAGPARGGLSPAA